MMGSLFMSWRFDIIRITGAYQYYTSSRQHFGWYIHTHWIVAYNGYPSYEGILGALMPYSPRRTQSVTASMEV